MINIINCHYYWFHIQVLPQIPFSSLLVKCLPVHPFLKDPLDANSKRNRVLGYFDYFFTTVFTIEIIFKIISYGAVQKGGYMRSPANLLDILVVGVSLVSILFAGVAGKYRVSHE